MDLVMNEQIQTHPVDGPVEKLRWAAAIALVIAGIVMYYVWSDRGVALRWAAMAAGLALGIGVFALSNAGRRFWAFVLDSRIELRKVVWPERQEAMTTTAVVFGFVAVAGLFFWLLDLLLTWATNYLTGQGG
jgi:preprotein translocase subunit SecE